MNREEFSPRFFCYVKSTKTAKRAYHVRVHGRLAVFYKSI